MLAVAGLTLLYLGVWLPPEGEIHSSLLVAFGETSTFAGALFGVDYQYRNKWAAAGKHRHRPLSDREGPPPGQAAPRDGRH